VPLGRYRLPRDSAQRQDLRAACPR
jgi:hypothetical protein